MNANTLPLDRELLRAVSAEPSPSPSALPSRPALGLVPAPRTRRRTTPLAGALTAVGVILAVLFLQLGLSIAVSAGAYESRALQVELRDLTRVERVLAQNVDKLASPQNLAVNAATLGMVQNTTPATLRLSDDAVLGDLAGGAAAITGNVVPNSTLDGLPVVGADGLLVDRNSEQAAAAAADPVSTAVAWEGALPAPQTR